MGGPGSGRRRDHGAKNATEDSQPLDIRKLQRAGVLRPGRSFGWQWTIAGKPVTDIRVRVEGERVVLVYQYRPRGDSEWENVEQPVYLDHTPCTYGGTRRWVALSLLRPARGGPLQPRQILRLPALLPAGLFQPAGKR
jgi:hypothetical protein